MVANNEIEVRNEFDHRIALMSFVSVVMVVFIHTSQNPSKEMLSWWSMQVFAHGICNMAVPYFFIVSGFFLGKHFGENGWWGFQVKKRVVTLLVPFFAWNVIMWSRSLVVDAVLNVKDGVGWLSNLPLGLVDLLKVIGVYPDFPFSVPTWYLRALFIFVLVSPVFIKGLLPLILVGIVKVVFDLFGWGGGIWHVFDPNGLFYFGIGCYLSQHPICIEQRRGLGFFSIAVAVCLAGLRAVIIFKGLMKGDLVGCIMVPLLLFGFWMVVPRKELPGFLRNSVMAIFLSHLLVSMTFFNVLKIVWPMSLRPPGAELLFETFGAQIVLVVLQVVGSLLIASVVRRSRLLSGILFGGRC